MFPEVKNDIISTLSEAVRLMKKSDILNLKELSNHTIHNASIYQDHDSITLAVIIYSFSKIIERSNSVGKEVIDVFKKALSSLKNNNFEQYHYRIKELIEIIHTIDKELNLYIKQVIHEAGIKKGSKIYDHGISLAQTAELLGISQWELMSFVGKTMITEEADHAPVEEKIKYTRELFNIK